MQLDVSLTSSRVMRAVRLRASRLLLQTSFVGLEGCSVPEVGGLEQVPVVSGCLQT